MNFNKKIIVVDDVLTKEECEDAIKTFASNSFDVERFRDTFFLPINQNYLNLVSLTHKIRNSISFLSDNIEVDWGQVVEWNEGSKQDYHKDTASNKTVLTSITYLNEGYKGGETSIKNDLNIIPKLGRTVYFDGNYYVHGVNEINSGVRYTLPIWYKLSV